MVVLVSKKKNGCDDESDRILFKWDSWDGRGIFCDINVHLWDKFERNFGRVFGKWKLLAQQEMFLYSLRKNYQISHATTKNVFTMFCMFNIAFLCKCNGWLIYIWYLGFYNLPHCIALVANIGRPWRKLINRISKWKELKLNFATVIAHWGLLLLYNEANNFKWNDYSYVSGEFARRSDFKFWDLEVFFVLTPGFNSLKLLNLLRS